MGLQDGVRQYFPIGIKAIRRLLSLPPRECRQNLWKVISSMKNFYPASFVSKTFLNLFCAASVVGLCATAAFAAPVGLRVNQRVDPLGIDTARPVLSWQSD